MFLFLMEAGIWLLLVKTKNGKQEMFSPCSSLKKTYTKETAPMVLSVVLTQDNTTPSNGPAGP